MSRPICWECGRKLAFVPGKGVVFQVYTDPVGNTHKLHKDCFKNGGFENKPVTAQQPKVGAMA